jgi:hypothetical protein
MHDSKLYLGYDATTSSDPLAGGTFSGSYTLGSFKVVGLTGAARPAFVNSVLAAQAVGTVSLQAVQTDNNHQLFGIVGHTVASVKILLPKPGLTWNNTHKGTTPGDFRVDIV